MKAKVLAVTLALLVVLAAGCAKKETTPPKQTTPPETTPEVKTTASIVDQNAAFEKAISSSGTWIIATVKDLTFTKDLVLEGEFKNGKKDDAGKDIIARKLALYAQDENRNVTARYTITAPKLTILSPNANISYGTFKGDVYVSAPNFQLIGGTVDGNVYFTTDEAKNTFTITKDGKVTGKQELKK